ncbi:MAG TPA: hypothetical protein VMG10_32775 [Gemmataceae bacterium]|nr:hypothetical protein [Gemmataceae bacterium]
MTTYEKLSAVVALALALLGAACVLCGGSWWVGLCCSLSALWVFAQSQDDADDEELDEEAA